MPVTHDRAEGKGDGLVLFHLDTGDLGCLLVSADGVELPAQGGVFQQEPEQHHEHHHQNGQQGDAAQFGGAQEGKELGDTLENRGAAGEAVDDAGEDGAHTQGGDEGQHPEPGHHPAVQQANEEADNNWKQEAHRHGQTLYRKQGGDDSAERRHAAHRQVELIDAHHQGGAQRDHHQQRDLAGDIDEIGQGAELVRADDAECCHDDRQCQDGAVGL